MNGKIGHKNAHMITCKRIYIHFFYAMAFIKGGKAPAIGLVPIQIRISSDMLPIMNRIWR